MIDHYMFSGQGVDLSLPKDILITRAQLDQGSTPTFANMVEFTELLLILDILCFTRGHYSHCTSYR